MNPFIVTAKRPNVVASRVAVATLEEAHETAREACLYAPGSVAAIAQAVRNIFALPESGGTVGPLPDGTAIEVQPVPLHGLARRANDDALLARALAAGDQPPASLVAECLASFNAKQAGTG